MNCVASDGSSVAGDERVASGIPPPLRSITVEMDTAKPAIDPIHGDPVAPPGEHVPAGVGDGDSPFPELIALLRRLASGDRAAILAPEERCARPAESLEVLGKDPTPQKDALLPLAVGGAERIAQRPRPGGDRFDRLTLRARQAVPDRRKLFQVTLERAMQPWQR